MQKFENEEGILLSFLRELKASEEVFPKKNLNLLKVAGLVRHEIRHSNLLAFFLNPEQPHGLADEFLKEFLSKIPYEKAISGRPFSRVHRSLARFSNIQVRREMMNIDVLIWSEELNYLLAIESKIDASQGARQLENYRIKLEENFPNYERQLVYLTVNGDIPNDASWVPVTWRDIFESLQVAFVRNRLVLTPEAIFSIEQYLDLLKTEIIMEEINLPLVEVCRKIYSEHKSAIDLILKYGAISNFADGAKQFFEEQEDIAQYQIGTTRAVFWPKVIVDACEKNGFILDKLKSFFGKNYAVALWFSLENEGKLRLIVEIGPWASSKRDKVIQDIKNNIDQSVTRNKTTSTYTRVWTNSCTIDDNPSVEEVVAAMKDLYSRVTQSLDNMADAIGNIDKKE